MSWTFTMNSEGGSKGLLVCLSTAWAVKVYCACSSRSRVFVAWMFPVLSSITKMVPAPSPERIYLILPFPVSTSEWSWKREMKKESQIYWCFQPVCKNCLCDAHPAHQHRIRSSVLLNDKKLIPDPTSFGPVENLPFLPTPLSVSVQGQVTWKHRTKHKDLPFFPPFFFLTLFWVTVNNNSSNITIQHVLQTQSGRRSGTSFIFEIRVASSSQTENMWVVVLWTLTAVGVLLIWQPTDRKLDASVLPECLCLWLLWSNDALPLRCPTATLKSAETPTNTRMALARPRPCALSITILMDASGCAWRSALYCCTSLSGALLPLSWCLSFVYRMLQDGLPNSLI